MHNFLSLFSVVGLVFNFMIFFFRGGSSNSCMKLLEKKVRMVRHFTTTHRQYGRFGKQFRRRASYRYLSPYDIKSNSFRRLRLHFADDSTTPAYFQYSSPPIHSIDYGWGFVLYSTGLGSDLHTGHASFINDCNRKEQLQSSESDAEAAESPSSRVGHFPVRFISRLHRHSPELCSQSPNSHIR